MHVSSFKTWLQVREMLLFEVPIKLVVRLHCGPHANRLPCRMIIIIILAFGPLHLCMWRVLVSKLESQVKLIMVLQTAACFSHL